MIVNFNAIQSANLLSRNYMHNHDNIIVDSTTLNIVIYIHNYYSTTCRLACILSLISQTGDQADKPCLHIGAIQIEDPI